MAGVRLNPSNNPFTNTGTITGYDYGVYGAGFRFTVSNLGTITAAHGPAVELLGGGVVSNGSAKNSTATIAGSVGVEIAGAGGGTITNLASITGSLDGVLLLSGGTITNGDIRATAATISGGDLGIFVQNAAGTIANFGSIVGGTDGAVLWAGGAVSNGSARLTSATIRGTAFGVVVDFIAGNVSNFGTIIATSGATPSPSGSTATYNAGVGFSHNSGHLTNAASGLIRGTDNGVAFFTNVPSISAGFGTVVNLGSIAGGSDGILMQAGGTVANGDVHTTNATISGGTTGIYDTGAAATITNSGTVAGGTTGIYLGAGGTVINLVSAGRQAVVNGSQNGIAARGTTDVTNKGLISSNRYGVYLSNGSVTNGGVGAAGAMITAVSVGVRFSSGNSAATVTNQGSIVGGTWGVYLGSGGMVANLPVGSIPGSIRGGQIGVYVNHGSGTVTSAGVISGSTIGVDLLNGGVVNNTLSRGIAGTISGATYGVFANGAAATVTNRGTINSGFYSVDLRDGGRVSNYGSLTGVLDYGGTVTNLGLISPSGTDVGVNLPIAGAVVNGSPSVPTAHIIGFHAVIVSGGTVTNYGYVQGHQDGISVTGGLDGSVDNSGTITAINDVTFSAGGSLVNRTGGIVLSGNESVQFFTQSTGSASATVTNAGTIAAPFGVAIDFMSRGAGQVLNETVANSGSITAANGAIEMGGGTVTNGTSAIISASAGHTAILGRSDSPDSVTVTNSGTISGGTGLDLQNGGTVSNGGTITGSDGTAARFGSSNNRLVIDPGGVFNGNVIGGSSNSLSNVLELAMGPGAGSISGIGAQFANFGFVVVDAGASWTCTGSNSIASVSELAVYGALTNAGDLQGNVDLQGGGSLSNVAGATVNGTAYGVAGAVTVTNADVISSTAAGGVKLEAGGLVTNGSTSASIVGANYGVYIGGDAGSVTNIGTITGPAVAGVLLNASGSVVNGDVAAAGASITGWSGVALYADGTVTNLGTITGGGFAGIDLVQGGSINNNKSGIVAGTVQANLFGVAVEGGAATISNAGTIAGATGIGFYPGAIGTVSTSGMISGTGGTAIDFGTGSDNVLKVLPGAVIQGTVTGAGSNTLELAGGGATGVISDVGTSFTSFGQLQIDSAASWRMSGPNTIAHVTDNGILTLVSNASLDVTMAVDPGDTGIYQLESNSDLEIASIIGTNTQMEFLGSAQITVDHFDAFGTNVGTSAYTGPLVEQFVAGDSVDLADFTVGGVSLSYTAATGLLQIANTASQHATLQFQDPTLGAGNFHFADDGTGHTLITHS